MFAPQQEEWVILGRTLDGEVFAIPDWAERLCGMLSAQAHDNRLSYSDYLHPARIEGLPAVVMRTSLVQADPQAFETIKRFVEENHLKHRPGRSRRNAEATGRFKALHAERRESESKC
jgi:hypothetical protein